ncbi:hypothetical protein TorRG33x02_354190, partial [Trema orientale]
PPPQKKLNSPYSSPGSYRGFSGLPGYGRGYGNRGNSSSFGRGRSQWRGNKPQCQLCGKPRHTGLKCFHQFDYSFLGPASNPASTSHSSAMVAHMVAMVATPDVIADPT